MKQVFAATIVCGVFFCVGCGPTRVVAPGADAEAAGRIRATLVTASSSGGTEQAAAATAATGHADTATLAPSA